MTQLKLPDKASLSEPSTWRGLIALAGVVGVSISPELSEHIITICVSAYGVIQIFRKEKAE